MTTPARRAWLTEILSPLTDEELDNSALLNRGRIERQEFTPSEAKLMLNVLLGRLDSLADAFSKTEIRIATALAMRMQSGGV